MSFSIRLIFRSALVFTSIALLFVMLWRLHDTRTNAAPPLAYNEFVGILDAGKVQNAKIYLGYDLSELRASLKDSSKTIRADVPTQELPKIIKQMMDGGASVEIARARRFDPAVLVLDIVPFALVFVLVIVIVLMRKRVAA